MGYATGWNPNHDPLPPPSLPGAPATHGPVPKMVEQDLLLLRAICAASARNSC